MFYTSYILQYRKTFEDPGWDRYETGMSRVQTLVSHVSLINSRTHAAELLDVSSVCRIMLIVLQKTQVDLRLATIDLLWLIPRKPKRSEMLPSSSTVTSKFHAIVQSRTGNLDTELP